MERSGGRLLFVLAFLLITSRICYGTVISVAAEDVEHGYVIFLDDFEDGESEDWGMDIPPEAPPGSSWTVELDDDNHVLSGSGQTWAEAGGYSWTNYTLEVRVKMKSPVMGGHLSVRLARPSRYFLQFYAAEMVITKEHLGTFTEVERAGAAFRTDRWYDFKIVCVGNSFWVYVDDVLKMDYVDEDGPILSGGIVLESCPGSHIYFDDVKVSTTYRLYVEHLIQEAQDEIHKAGRIDADTTGAEQRLSEAQAAFSEDDLSSAESLAEEAVKLARKAPVGAISVENLLKYPAEYDRRTVEISGIIRDIRYQQGLYSFAVDDGTGVISATFNRTLGEIKAEDEVKVVGVFDASSMKVDAESLEKLKAPTEGLYTFLIFKDDFEDGDHSGWRTQVNPQIEGAAWKVEKEVDNYVLSGHGECLCEFGDLGWTDYILQLRVKLIDGDANIQFRATSKPPYGADLYALSLSTRHTSGLTKAEVHLKEQRHTELKYLDLSLDQDEWYDVKIICLEDNVKIYLNDVLKLDYTDDEEPFISGSIGLHVPPNEGDTPSHVLFDDVKISRMATTTDINDLINYAQSEIDGAREVNADVNAAEMKLDQAKQALAQENYQMVQYMVDEAVWLAKHSSIGPTSIQDLRAKATLCSGHVVVITGTVERLQAQYGTGYNFNLNDGTGEIAVSYQGTMVDIGDGYEVRVTGTFDSTIETVAASRIEKISGTSTPTQSGPFGLTLNIEMITTFITIGGAAAGVIGWFVRHESAERRRKVLFKKLMDEVDDVYSRFKMNAIQCEAELYRLRDEVLDEFKEGMIDEDKHSILEQRIEKYMKEVREEIQEKPP